MSDLYKRWRELSLPYRVLVLAFVLLGLAAIADAIETIETLYKIMQ